MGERPSLVLVRGPRGVAAVLYLLAVGPDVCEVTDGNGLKEYAHGDESHVAIVHRHDVFQRRGYGAGVQSGDAPDWTFVHPLAAGETPRRRG